ncbi:hypothetical protein Misp01_76540 [Microtetraspora sp. NBRC 13810]|uniref:hypothetical protein n=1 Tax=Microtetraspora sp. NBRC 13810 TaxID=3030990 RepID=UPI0024A23233|nr:hypothetical protein [Microtetraspora sp. NBRC 13810]GLW12526.1 hypothetical protein Misp01_76540 [Microtetraspora sp. NBRC 13810]
MTITHPSRADEVREACPGWLIWHLGPRWWAMHKQTAVAIAADSIEDLHQALDLAAKLPATSGLIT